jgi:hypothetical protein
MFEIPSVTKKKLKCTLKPSLLLTTRIEIAQPEYVWVRINAAIKVKAEAIADLVKRRVMEKLCIWLHPQYGGSNGEGWPFGQGLTVDRIYAFIDAIEGVDAALDVAVWQLEEIKIEGNSHWQFNQKEHPVTISKNAVLTSAYHVITD